MKRLRTSVEGGVDYHPYLPREDGRLPMSDFGGVHRYNVTGLFHDMWGFPSDNPRIVQDLLHQLVDKINNNVHQIARLKEYYLEDATTILISYGSSARSALHVVENHRLRGDRLGLLELQTLWPFPYGLIREKMRQCQIYRCCGNEYGPDTPGSEKWLSINRKRFFWPTGLTEFLLRQWISGIF